MEGRPRPWSPPGWYAEASHPWRTFVPGRTPGASPVSPWRPDAEARDEPRRARVVRRVAPHLLDGNVGEVGCAARGVVAAPDRRRGRRRLRTPHRRSLIWWTRSTVVPERARYSADATVTPTRPAR